MKTTMGLTRDGLRTYYAKNLLKDGKIFAKDFTGLIPKGVPNIFKPSETIKLGGNYNFKVNNVKVQFRIHSPDKQAKKRHIGSNSGSQWTAQIKVGNKFLGTDGEYHRMNNKTANMLHIPFKMK
ncbi:MAG: polymorphic toxin type 30 domain-containing protein [Sulfurimonas sp.]